MRTNHIFVVHEQYRVGYVGAMDSTGTPNFALAKVRKLRLAMTIPGVTKCTNDWKTVVCPPGPAVYYC